MLLIVSGPSGVGKSRLIDVAVQSLGFGHVVPVTTRPMREGERPGVDYEFATPPAFHDLIRGNHLCAWDYTLRNYYGYRTELERRLHGGENVAIHGLGRMAVRMARQLPDVFLIYLQPSSESLLESRLMKRQTEPDELLLRRLHWEEEASHSGLFDWIIREADVTPTEELAKLLAEVTERFS